MAIKPNDEGASKEAPDPKDIPTIAPRIFSDRGPQDNVAGGGYSAGNQLFDPSIAAMGGGRSYASALTARAGGGRPNATKVTAAVNRITVCATAADSVSIPPAVGGQVIYVVNNGASACQVFADPSTSDTINGIAAATGVSLAAAKSATFASPGPGIWYWNLSA
jgi:hypothetical protein